jgi:hypothetical protein
MAIKKSDSLKYVNEVTKFIIELGAIWEQTVGDGNVYTLDTPLGDLNISLYDSNVHCYTTFTRFEDVPRAKLKVNCNPHSGKYNLHIPICEVDTAIEITKTHIEIILN